MAPLVAASLVSGLASLSSSALQYKLNQKQNARNMALQDRYNLKNWALQNQYNSPSAQMARLRAAGLNPNLIYQNGGANIGAGEIGSPQPMNFESPDFSAAISHGLDVYNAGLQADSVQAEISKKTAETENIQEDTNTKYLSNKFLPRQFRLTLRGLSAQNAKTNAEANLLAQQRDYYSQLTGLTRQQIQNATLEYPRSLAEIQNLNDQHRINGVEYTRLQKLCTQIDKETDLIKKQAMQAFLNNSLLNMRLLANKGNRNEFTMAIDQLEEVINNLHFENSDEYRSNRLAPGGILEPLFKSGSQFKFDFDRKFGHSYNHFNRY